MSKYANKIYACPECWKALADSKRIKVLRKGKILSNCCDAYLHPDSLVIFDSQVEHEKGIDLKAVEKVGLIEDLKHHEKFELLPALHLTGNKCQFDNGVFLFSTNIDHFYARTEKIKAIIENVYNGIDYESDFSFTENDKKRVIEVKDLGKKKAKGFYRDPKTKEKVKTTYTINWPFFTRQDPLSHFRLKCQLMKARYHVDVEIWAGSKRFRFDEKWKLVEVSS